MSINANEFFGSWSGASKKNLEPMLEWNAMTLKLMERGMQQQFEMLSACLTAGIQQCQMFAGARKVEDMENAFKAQTELLTEMGKKMVQNAQNTLDLVTEGTEATRKLVEKAVSRCANVQGTTETKTTRRQTE